MAEGRAGEGGQSQGCARHVHKLADICKRSGCSNSFHPSCCERSGKPSYGVDWKNYFSAGVKNGRTVLTPVDELRLKLQYLLCLECFARIPASHTQSDFCEGTGAQQTSCCWFRLFKLALLLICSDLEAAGELLLTLLCCAEREVAAREHRRSQQMASQLKQRKLTRAVQRMAECGRPMALAGVFQAGNPYRVLTPSSRRVHCAAVLCRYCAAGWPRADTLAGSSRRAGDSRVAMEQAAQRLGTEGAGATAGSHET